MTPQSLPERKPLSEASRIAGVFFSPKETFTDVLERPRWYIPVILITVLSLIFVFLLNQHIGWEQLSRQAIEQNPRTAEMSPEQKQQAINMSMKFTGISYYVGATVAPVIMVLIVGAVLMFVANGMLGTQLKLGQMMGVTGYAFLTGLITTPLTILVMFLKNKEDFNIRNPLAFNVGAFLGEQSPRWLQSLGSSLDLMSFWTIALLAIGISCAGRKISFGKALMAVLIPWAVWVLIKVAGSALFG